jgi:GDP/UDP-N,N'-diacetylbacillosamine 2-epimerase (hydrolysing)
MIKIISKILITSSRYFQKNRSDLLIVLGDRFETLAVTVTAYILGLKIAHIHGGETSLGSLDHGFRNAITHFSTLHFTSTKAHCKRVSEMLGTTENIFNVGALAVENTKNILKLNSDVIYKNKKIVFEKNNFLLLTFHSVSSLPDKGITELQILLNDLEILGMKIIATSSNVDSGGKIINSILRKQFRIGKLNGNFYENLGSENYLTLMKNSFAVVGNSSSLLIEAPIMGVPSFDFGSRQFGRIAPRSVFRIKAKHGELISSLKSTKIHCVQPTLLYGHGNTSIQIARILEKQAR